MQDQRRFPEEKVLRISRHMHITIFTDWVKQSVEGGIKPCKLDFR